MSEKNVLAFFLEAKDFFKGKQMVEKKLGITLRKNIKTVLFSVSILCLVLYCILQRITLQVVILIFCLVGLIFITWFLPFLINKKESKLFAENGIFYQIIPSKENFLIYENSSVYRIDFQELEWIEGKDYIAIRYKKNKNFFIPKTLPNKQIQLLKDMFFNTEKEQVLVGTEKRRG